MLHRRRPMHAPTRLDTRNVRLGVSASITAVLLSVFALTRTERGVALLGRGVGFLEYYAGVFALVLLTATVALGLLTTERVFLSPSNRIRAQLAHRATAFIGLAYLVTHITLMISLGHVPPGAAIVPVAGVYVGLGALAFDLMVVAVVTGVLRGRFAVRSRPWMWRILHSAAYVAWPVGIMHGLTAGRPPAGWVAWSYVACMAAVGSALVVRVLASLRRPPVPAEQVAGPAVSPAVSPAAPMVVPQARPQKAPVTAAAGGPVSLADARRRFREAG
ncbi:DMSO/TMAO reductase YedYZ, heme-binding membrane subunit [Nonomuraea maritima]|uniref:DMSO/TMAO reductase YedYZ, heme-binding membrane subunit n=1 Tax=Nonomuraea maritima TaxID=683260 RepID=A0A1G9ALM6_9ACTN|nr:ferric reductase-like transmembrane domain-containing protein [Nonomuraea maritima]SDK28188.1 DMSO/TMAO reductase YedYZ, heme-binding membrane subunit [Nonomuraea maritima]